MANNKSNISLLQEVLIKKGYVPIYHFMEKNIDMISKQFVCVVSCKTFKATGTGNSKKQAKHDAAKNMLSLLVEKNEISLPVDISSSSSVTNVAQNPVQSLAKLQEMFSSHQQIPAQSSAKVYEMSSSHQQIPTQNSTKVYEMSSSHQQSATGCNYVGMLQEFCQQGQINVKDIIYNVVYEGGLPHMKTFTIEVSLGSLRERGMASCKKSAKQEAARKLLMHLKQKLANSNVDQNATEHSSGATSNTANSDHLNPANTTNLNVASLERIQSNIANTNILTNNIKVNDIDKETLKNTIRDLGTEILDSVTNRKETCAIEELTEKAKSLYIESFNKRYNRGLDHNTDPSEINSSHTLFERNYSIKIPYDTREKMRIVRDSCVDAMNLMREIGRDLESLLKVKLQQFPVCNTENKLMNNHIMCARLLSNPCITQIGIGKTRAIAESRAMYNLITAILILLDA
ncbi:uncharacterized protein LOC105835118 isoform X2 [Monomorium pharaonis]|uniref:uncharacterized protein LOC105835118 isoform X2 n=1 Tax=Monomorium pharaonis TaxID=307658 RepID=UPI00063F040C|nr:uncharacterized protein LOC105835118 isoform X2 [Monomorium pharaonis]